MAHERVTYTFETCLGRGGYGEVYLATSIRPGGLTRRVAVKVLRTGIAKENEALRRLKDEGRLLAVLDHPSILAVHEMTRIDGRVALVTEYVEGIDVSRCCKPDFRLPARAVVGILGEVGAALHTAASTISPETGKPLALIHRDIKPENIRLSKHGEVKLLDFGIARSTEMDREAQTMAGTLPFTPGYAAPECFNEGRQSAASDVYALGATGYRMLATERLLEGHDVGSHLMLVASAEVYERFLEQRMARIDADPRVADLIRSMLSFDPEDRPTAAQVQQRCEVLVDHLDGLTHVRWARSTPFAPPRRIVDGGLTGRTFEADVLMPSGGPPIPRSSPPLPVVPPVPAALSNHSIKPDTEPFGRPTASSPLLTPLDSLPIPLEGLETLPSGIRADQIQADLDTVVLDRPDLPGPPVATGAAGSSTPGGWGGFLVKMGVFGLVLVAVGVTILLVSASFLWVWVG